MRYCLFNECINLAATKEIRAGLKFDNDPLNIREDTVNFTTISEVLHSEAHDVQQRVGITIHEEMYFFV